MTLSTAAPRIGWPRPVIWATSLLPWLFKIWPSALQTGPSLRIQKLASHLPRGERGPSCPLCQSDNSDTWHYATQCPVTAHVRQLIRRCCGSLFAGLSVASELTTDPARALLEWFRSAVQYPSSTIFGTDTYSPESAVVLRVLIGKSTKI